ncbi:protein slow green 1, chloroplastic [Tanacetum coccineum]|uniref:Protein slow green 1, chloroplastic n=1 Tax=Tanacetum coccineum TaxID=301880 RepID=A0ABQ5DSC6_9ASTR
MGFRPKKPVLAQTQRVERVDLDEEEMMMYTKLLEGDSKNVEALKAIFHGKMKRGKTKEAIEYIHRLIAIEPKQVEWRLLQALCYEMIGDFSKAKSLFKNVLKERPLLLRALHGLAMVMHKNLEGPAVFEMLNNALEIARQRKKVTDERNIRILIAQMHVVKGELDDAMKQLKDLIEENPRDFRPYLCQEGCDAALETLPADMEAGEKAALMKKAYSFLILCLGDRVLREVTKETTPAGIWNER